MYGIVFHFRGFDRTTRTTPGSAPDNDKSNISNQNNNNVTIAITVTRKTIAAENTPGAPAVLTTVHTRLYLKLAVSYQIHLKCVYECLRQRSFLCSCNRSHSTSSPGSNFFCLRYWPATPSLHRASLSDILERVP